MAKPRGILWIASYPKSGNTWVRAFLNNLVAIIDGVDEGRAHSINAINRYSTWDVTADRYAPHLGKPAALAERAEVARARPLVQAEIARDTDGLAIVKTHNSLVLDHGYPTINWEVTRGALYIVRNPLDVAVSFAHHMSCGIDHAIAVMGAPGFLTRADENRVHEFYGSWSVNVESWTRQPSPVICVVRYEDLLADPRAGFRRLAAHFGLHPSPEQLDLAIARSSFKELRRQEEAEGYEEKPPNAERFFRTGRAGEWKRALTQAQIRAVVRDHHRQMRRFRYLTDKLARLV